MEPILIAVSVYFGALLLLAFLRKRKDEELSSYLVGDRRLGIFKFVAALVSTTYGWILGSGQLYYELGISAWLILSLPYLLFSALYAIFFAKKARQMNVMALTDILQINYDKRVQNLGTIVLLLFLSPVMYLLMAGQILSFISGIAIIPSIGIVTVFSTVYVLSGGFKTMVKAEVIQFLLMFCGFTALVLFLVLSNGTDMLLALPESKTSMHVPGSWTYLLTWFVLASVTLVDPSYNQRVYAVKNSSIAIKGILIAIVLWLFFDLLSALSSLYGEALLGSTDSYLIYPKLAQFALPPWLAAVFFVGLLSMVMSTADSFLFLSATLICRDLIHGNNLLKQVDQVKLIRWMLLVCALLAFLLTSCYSDSTAVGIFFDFVPIVVSVVLLPILSCYLPRLRMSSGLVFTQMLLSLALCLVWIFIQRQVSDLKDISAVFPGLALSACFQAIWILRTRFRKRG